MHKFRIWSRPITKAGAAAGVVAGSVLGVGASVVWAAGSLPTSTVLSFSPTSPISYGTSDTLTATVTTDATNAPFTTGDTVTFSISGGSFSDSDFPHTVAITSSCLAPLNQTCQFSWTPPNALPVGTDTITASYSGNVLAASSQSTQTLTVNATPPSAPTLTVTAGSAENTLNWTTPASGGASITDYNVYRSTTPAGEVLFVGNLPASANTYEDTAVTATTYYYKVAASNSAGTGPRSNEASGTPTFPSGTIINCGTGQSCSLDQVAADSHGLDTNVNITSGSLMPQTLSNSLSSSGISCGTSSSSVGLWSSFNDTATDQGKTLSYTLYGSEATAANQTYTQKSPMCLGLGSEFSGWFLQGTNWTYGPVPFNNTDGLYEGIVATCASAESKANPGQPCVSFSTGTVDHDGESPTGSGSENQSSGSKKNINFWTATVTLPPGDGRIGSLPIPVP